MDSAEHRIESEIKIALLADGLKKRIFQFVSREIDIIENHVLSEIEAKKTQGKRLYKEDGEKLIAKTEALHAMSKIANELEND